MDQSPFPEKGQNKMKKCLMIYCALLIMCFTGYSSTLYVPYQFDTIQEAIDASCNGDLIVVGPGDYHSINFKGKAITIKSSVGPSLTTVNQVYGGPMFSDYLDRQSILEGFHITISMNDTKITYYNILTPTGAHVSRQVSTNPLTINSSTKACSLNYDPLENIGMNGPKSRSNIAICNPAALFKDHMVLQRDMANIPVWGTATPFTTIYVDFNGIQYTTTANMLGDWFVYLNSTPCGGPYQLLIDAPNAANVLIEDVMVGEVWFCSGQSNMRMTMSVCDEKDDLDRIANNLTNVRYMEFIDETSLYYREWIKVDPNFAGAMYAVPFYFAKNIYETPGVPNGPTKGVPVGIIQCAKGGTPLETWMSPGAAINSGLDPRLDIPGLAPSKKPCENFVYVKEAIPYGIRGVLWYQGESNVLIPETYCSRFLNHIEGWRNAWGQQDPSFTDFPYLFVQLPNFVHNPPLRWASYYLLNHPFPSETSGFVPIRDAQFNALKSTSVLNKYMAVTIDVGDYTVIHPLNKKDPGKRLALLARSHVYNEPSLIPSGPIYEDMTIVGDEVYLRFSEIGEGLYLDPACAHASLGFAITDVNPHTAVDADFAWVDSDSIRILGDKVIVSKRGMLHPTAVRYAWEHHPYLGLYNTKSSNKWLPASPFQTE